MSLGGLLYYIGENLLWWLIMMGLVLLFCIPFIIGMILLFCPRKTASLAITAILPILMFLIMLPLMCYVIVRYTLVFPLAACRVKSSIKTAVQLMRGNMWRVFVNILPVWLIMFPFTPMDMCLLSKIAVLFDPGTPENSMGCPWQS